MSEGWDKAADLLQPALDQLRQTGITDTQAPDFCGALRHYERLLADLRRALLAETGEQTGERYEIRDAGSWAYSFNPSGILSDVMARCDVGPFEAVRMLRDEGAADLVFRKSGLEAFYLKHRMGLHTVQGEAVEADDVEAPRLGRVWRPRLSAEPKEEK